MTWPPFLQGLILVGLGPARCFVEEDGAHRVLASLAMAALWVQAGLGLWASGSAAASRLRAGRGGGLPLFSLACVDRVRHLPWDSVSHAGHCLVTLDCGWF